MKAPFAGNIMVDEFIKSDGGALSITCAMRAGIQQMSR